MTYAEAVLLMSVVALQEDVVEAALSAVRRPRLPDMRNYAADNVVVRYTVRATLRRAVQADWVTRVLTEARLPVSTKLAAHEGMLIFRD